MIWGRYTLLLKLDMLVAMVMDKDGKTQGFDMGDTIWCEEPDPTMPWVEEYDYENKEWKDDKISRE